MYELPWDDQNGRSGKPSFWHYWTDTHPRTEGQFKNQKWLASWFPYYGDWMRGRASDELTGSNRNAYGLKWEDIKSPWVASLSGGDEASALGRGMSTISSNFTQLYSSHLRRKRDKDRRERIKKSREKRPYHTDKPWWMSRY